MAKEKQKKSKSIVRSTKFRVIKPPHGDAFWSALWQALDETQKAANEVMTELYLHDKARRDYFQEHDEWPNNGEVERFMTYRSFSSKYSLNSRILSMLYPQHPHNPARGGGYVGGIWKARCKEVMRGKASLPTIRWGRIPFKATCLLKDGKLQVVERDGDLWWPLPLGGKINKKTGEGWSEVRIATRKLDASRKAILERLMDGTYKGGDFQLAWNSRRKLLEIVISYTMPGGEKKAKKVDGRCLGVDLGIKQTVAALSDSQYQVGWQALHEATSQMIQVKKGIEARRREMLRRLSRPDIKRGRGLRAKYRPIARLDRKWDDFRRTWNHTLSRRIVDLADSENCEMIRLEDLHGKLTDTRTFLGATSAAILSKDLTSSIERNTISRSSSARFAATRVMLTSTRQRTSRT